MMGFVRTRATALALGMMLMTVPAGHAATALQCVPYARVVSGINIQGDARTWWDQAQGRYDRGSTPRKGAVIAFKPYGPMTLGHVAVVSKVLGPRDMLVRHANWSEPGAIEEDVLVRDVSDDGDWSAVRVWHSPTGQMGVRTNPVFGFIYADQSRLNRFVPERDAGGTRFAVLTSDSVPVHNETTSSSPARRFLSDLRPSPAKPVRLRYDLRVAAMDDAPVRPAMATRASAPTRSRTLADIIADVKKGARIG